MQLNIKNTFLRLFVKLMIISASALFINLGLKQLFLVLMPEEPSRSLRIGLIAFWCVPFIYRLLYPDQRSPTFSVGALLVTAVCPPICIILVSYGLIVLTAPATVVYHGLHWALLRDLVYIVGFVILEEVCFRGVIFRELRGKYGFKFSMVITSLLFGILHLGNEHLTFLSLVEVILLGSILNLIYYRHERLLPVILFHGLWNTMLVVLGTPLSGTELFEYNTIWKTTFGGTQVLHGGDFGLEGSLFLVIISACYFIFLLKKEISKETHVEINSDQNMTTT